MRRKSKRSFEFFFVNNGVFVNVNNGVLTFLNRKEKRMDCY